MNIHRIIYAALLLFLLAALAGVFYQTGNVRRAKAEAEALRNERIELTRAAREASSEAEMVRAGSILQVAAAHEKQRVAERRADSLEAHTALLTNEATESGQRVLESARALLGATDTESDLEALVLAHLEDDRQLALSTGQALYLGSRGQIGGGKA